MLAHDLLHVTIFRSVLIRVCCGGKAPNRNPFNARVHELAFPKYETSRVVGSPPRRAKVPSAGDTSKPCTSPTKVQW